MKQQPYLEPLTDTQCRVMADQLGREYHLDILTRPATLRMQLFRACQKRYPRARIVIGLGDTSVIYLPRYKRTLLAHLRKQRDGHIQSARELRQVIYDILWG